MKKETSCGSGGKSFVTGVFALSLSTLIVKIIGLAFKIPMLSLLGMEGMGYFNSAYEIYAMLCVVSTAGLPVALSILISAARAREDFFALRRTYRSSLAIFLAFGVLGAISMLLFSKSLASAIGNYESYYSIIAIAPALLFICLASAIRGYCQGFEEMKPTAVSQIIEAVAKLFLGVAFAVFGIKRGYSVSVIAALSVLSISVGTFFSLCYLAIARRRLLKKRGYSALYLSSSCSLDKAASRKSYGGCAELLRIALPITLSSAVISLTRIIDMTFIMRRLQDAGVSQFRANEIYGAYTTLVLPVFSLIPSLIAPISMALIPELSGFIERKLVAGQTQSVEKALRLTAIFSMPAALGLTLFSRQILSLLFRGQSEAIEIADPLLSLFGVSVLFSCLITTTNAILQAYRCVKSPIVSMAVGVTVKAVSAYFLLGNGKLLAYGAPISSLACNLTVTLLNFALMLRNTGSALDSVSAVKSFLKPFFASVISVGGAYAVYLAVSSCLSATVSFILAAALALIGYFALVFLLGSVNEDDMRFIPILNKAFNKKIKEKR